MIALAGYLILQFLAGDSVPTIDTTPPTTIPMTNPTPTPQPATPVAWCRSDDFRDALLKRQSFSGWREPHPDCDMALYAQLLPSPAQPIGPSLEEVSTLMPWLVDEAIKAADAGRSKDAGMLTWAAQVIGERVNEDAPAAGQPVNLAELHDPDFSGGLTPSQHLDVVHGGPDPRVASTASPGLPPRVGHVLRLAEIIREVDSRHSLGAAALAEAILAHPGFSGCHDGPVAAPAQGEVAKLVAALEADAECVAAEQPDLMQLTDKQLTRIAELLNGTPHA